MHENRRATAARTTWSLSLLLALGAGSSPALAQAPAAKPAAAPATAGGASAKPKRKLPMRACPARVPEGLNPPPDVTLELVLPASGVQSYACVIDKPGEAPDWAPKAPHAMLGEGSNLMGIHFGGPSWQAMDGSLIKGTKISSASAPDKSAVVWLLLSGAATGDGVFGKITHIQRMDTVGGRPPQGGCDAEHLDTRVLVPYRSNYYFYREAAPGETVRQCRGLPSKTGAGDKGGKGGKDKSDGTRTGGAKPAAAKPAAAMPAAAPPAKPAAEGTADKPAKGSAPKPAGAKPPNP